MTAWRSKASELIPELAPTSADSWSVHVFFADLVAHVLDAHRTNDLDRLNQAYGFAGWCLQQPGRFLADAAVLSFYEHLFDAWELRTEVARWLPVEVVPKLLPLLQWRLPACRLAEVGRLLGPGHGLPDVV